MSTEQTPFDPQRVYTEIARLVQLLSPGADMIELRFELGGRKARLPIPTLGPQRMHEAAQPDAIKAGSLAAEILQVLKEHPGQWLTGPEIGVKIGGDVNVRGGTFIEAIRKLKQAKLIRRGGDEYGQGYQACE